MGSVHFVVIILVARTQHGLECSFIRFKAVEKGICPRGLKKNNTKRAIVVRACSYKKPKTIKRLVSASKNNQRLVYRNGLRNRGKLNVISIGSISGGVPYSMGAEVSFRPWFRGGMCPSFAMM